MIKPTYIKILLFILIKYICFYIFLMVKNSDYKLLEWENIKSGNSLLYFSIIMVVPILLSILVSSVPLYLSFRSTNSLTFILIIVLAFILEYFAYIYSTSEMYFYDWNGVFNVFISTILFFVLFYKFMPFFKQSLQ